MSVSSVIIQQVQLPLSEKNHTGLRGHFFAPSVEEQVFRPTRHNPPKDDEVLSNATGVGRPSITLHPSWEEYKKRSDTLAKLRPGLPLPSLPDGFPSCVTGPR